MAFILLQALAIHQCQGQAISPGLYLSVMKPSARVVNEYMGDGSVGGCGDVATF